MMRSVLQDWWGSFGIASLSGSIADCVNSFVETGKTPALSLSEERMAEDFVAFARGMADAIWSDLERLLAEREKLTDEDRLEEWRQLSSQEIVFYFRVWFPCWLEYGVSATHLLRDARHGDMQAIDHIFRLDEVTLQDPPNHAPVLRSQAGPNQGQVQTHVLCYRQSARPQTDSEEHQRMRWCVHLSIL